MKYFSFALLLISFPAFSQIENVSKFLELGVSPLSYKGDLSQGYENWTSGFHIGLKRNTKEKWNGHFNLMIGNVTGQNPEYTYPASSSTPSLFFKTNLISLNYDLQYNLLKKNNFILYISQGIGLLRFSPKDEENNSLSDKFTTRAKDENFNNISFIFPHYIGFIYFLKNSYGLGMNIGRINPATDYIDNISKLSNYKKPDNIFSFRFSIFIPISFKEAAPATE